MLSAAIDEKKDVIGGPISPEIEELFDAGAHIGYSKSRRHPKMKDFIFGTRNNVEIFDLGRTSAKLKDAEEFLKNLGKEKKMVLWVGTKSSAKEYVQTVGMHLGLPYVAQRWLGGTLTNFRNMEQRLHYWEQLENESKTGGLDKYSKKERQMKMTELQKLEKTFGGLRALKTLPSAVVIIDPAEENTAVAEAIRKNIPIVALLNVDCDPRGIAYPIPANDNASLVISIVIEKLSLAYSAGVKEGASS